VREVPLRGYGTMGTILLRGQRVKRPELRGGSAFPGPAFFRSSLQGWGGKRYGDISHLPDWARGGGGRHAHIVTLKKGPARCHDLEKKIVELASDKVVVPGMREENNYFCQSRMVKLIRDQPSLS